MQMQVKVCGMKEPSNIMELQELPINYIGFIFYERSPRFINGNSPANVKQGIKKVGVFVNSDVEFVIDMVAKHGLDFVQLHGGENIFYCQRLRHAGIQIIKVFNVDEKFSFTNTHAYQYFCDYFLFDTKVGDKTGGTGKQFDWNLLKKYTGDTPFFLSGGINLPAVNAIKKLNMETLIAVDINSKFEVSPGLKNIDLVKQFISQLKGEA